MTSVVDSTALSIGAHTDEVTFHFETQDDNIQLTTMNHTNTHTNGIDASPLQRSMSESTNNQIPTINGQMNINIDNDTASLLQVHPLPLRFSNVTKKLEVNAQMAGVAPSGGAEVVGGKTYKVLLDNVSGMVKPGEIMALMGPSGSGKTTLLNSIGGRSPLGLTGTVTVDGELWNKGMKRKLAYVQQEDLFFMHLTVKEQLTYTALLRLPPTMTKAEKLVQVDRTIETLGITKCQHSPIMFLSGGEKKRVNIATELLTNPALLLLDEPTSGLDSTSAFSLMQTLRSLANQGRTIITSIHQPNSQVFQSFDRLLLLADGNVVYSGPPSKATAYFKSLGYQCPKQYNPADYVMDLTNDPEKKKHLIEAYKKNPLEVFEPEIIKKSTTSETELNEPKWPTSWSQQFSVLYARANKHAYSELFTRLNWIQCLFLAIISGLCWFRMEMTEKYVQDRSAFVFFVLTFWPMNALFTALMSFPPERAVIDKERASGSYRLSAYFIAKSAAEAPLKLVLPTIFLIIAFWMGNINPSFPQFLGFLISELLCVTSAESIGIFLGAAIRDMMQAMTVAIVSMLGIMLVGGFFIKNLPIFFKWTKYLSIFKYSFDAALQFVYGGSYIYNCDGTDMIQKCIDGATHFTGDDAIDYLKVQGSIEFNLLILIGIGIAFRIFAYLALRFVKNASGRQ